MLERNKDPGQILPECDCAFTVLYIHMHSVSTHICNSHKYTLLMFRHCSPKKCRVLNVCFTPGIFTSPSTAEDNGCFAIRTDYRVLN